MNTINIVEEFHKEELTLWDLKYMKTALDFSKMSKCAAKGVACLIVKENSIISTGINGTLSSITNCNDKFHKEDGVWYKASNVRFERCEDQREHYNWSLLNEIHAEINAIGKTSKMGISTKDSVAYVTHSPCHDCAKTLVVAGISKIYYHNEFDNIDEVKKFLYLADVKLIKIDVGDLHV